MGEGRGKKTGLHVETILGLVMDRRWMNERGREGKYRAIRPCNTGMRGGKGMN